MIVSTDIGGTFTDYIVLEKGRLRAYKKLTTENVADGIKRELRGVDEFHHGSTVGINALLERKGVRVALITTRGFGTLHRIGRQSRLNLYSFLPRREHLPVHRVIEVEERVSARGEVLKELDDRELATKLEDCDCDAAAIVFINSYVNPENEIKAKDIASRYFEYVFTSHEVRREIREYEREATTVIEAYIYPIVERYLRELSGIGREFYVMQSNGGKLMPRYLKGINTLMSGPAGGVAASEYLGKLMGIENILTYDMGGTSADMGLVVDGSPVYASTIYVDAIPIRVTSIEILSIGAGGGSVAWLDDAKSLKVGPRSAGSLPGPACYGKGGKEFTVTDANLMLGVLGERISEIRLHRELAEKAAEALGRELNLSTPEIAEGVIRIVNNNMALAMKKISLSRGYDPRNFTLFSFGGAGPMHACSLAHEVGIRRIVVPPMAGAFSSLGILLAPVRYDSKITILKKLDRGMELIPELVMEFRKKADEILGDYELSVSLEMRYSGQGHELTVPLTENLRKEFEELHRRVFGFTMDEEIEIVNVSFVATKRREIKLPKMKAGENRIKEKRVYRFSEKIPVYPERNFRECEGPCIVEASTTTILVEEGWSARMNEWGAIVMEWVG